ncbi:MAG: hypothetical protein WBN22_00990 [Verrucomicrobiia bacterium]
MTTENAIRWLAHESKECRDRDSCEAFCLLLPALLRVLALDAMHEAEAAAFRHEFKQRLNLLPFQDATDRALARPVLLARSMQPDSSNGSAKKTDDDGGFPARAPGLAPGRLQPAPASS